MNGEERRKHTHIDILECCPQCCLLASSVCLLGYTYKRIGILQFSNTISKQGKPAYTLPYYLEK